MSDANQPTTFAPSLPAPAQWLSVPAVMDLVAPPEGTVGRQLWKMLQDSRKDSRTISGPPISGPRCDSDDAARLEDDNASLVDENDDLRRQLEDYERVRTELASIRDMIDSLLGGR